MSKFVEIDSEINLTKILQKKKKSLSLACQELGGSGGGRSVTSDIFGVGAASRDETGSGWIVNRQGQLGWGQLPAVGRESDDDLEENDEDDLMLKLQRLLRRDLPWLVGVRGGGVLEVLS